VLKMTKFLLTNKEYDFIYSRSPRICVDLIIKTKDGVLLSKRLIKPYLGAWHLPGGRIRFREKINDSIKRIAKAELGVIVTDSKLIGIMQFPHETRDGIKLHSISLGYLIFIKELNLQGSIQARLFKFFKTAPKKRLSEHIDFLIKNKYLK